MLDVLVRTWNVVLGMVCLYAGGYMLTLHLASWEALRGDLLLIDPAWMILNYAA